LCGAIIIAGLFSGNVAATPGDRLSVTVKRANVRTGPSTSHPIVYQLQRGSKVIELQHKDDWIEVDSKDSNSKSGWIHSTLLSKDTAGEKPITSNKTVSSDPLFDLFMQAFEQYQAKVKTNTGQTYFAKVENPGNRVIQLTITNDWVNLSRPERDAQLTEIFNIWNAAVGDDLPITVDIIDQDGTRLLSKFK
ncbi:MAG: putative N-acetylmuramoyl-L-alanine amidase, partial [Gammaproteobacteria bacterium]|nr:putative N-acetylmuramoyl-L-alanine amidase [Gammaproteobacteria bacterium]